MAIANVFACSFIIVMTTLAAATGFYVVVPSVSSTSEWSVTVHRLFYQLGLPFFMNVCGIFLLCLYIDILALHVPRK